MKLSESIALHTPVLKAGGVGSGPQLPAIQREIAQRMANHLKVVSVHTPSQSRFSPTPKLSTPGKVGHGGSAPKAPSGGPKMTKSAPRPGGRIGAGGPGSGRHAGTLAQRGWSPMKNPPHAVSIYQHPKYPGHTITVNDKRGHWAHKNSGNATIAKGRTGKELAEHLRPL